MYSNNILNFQESTTILNAYTKKRQVINWMHRVPTRRLKMHKGTPTTGFKRRKQNIGIKYWNRNYATEKITGLMEKIKRILAVNSPYSFPWLPWWSWRTYQISSEFLNRLFSSIAESYRMPFLINPHHSYIFCVTFCSLWWYVDRYTVDELFHLFHLGILSIIPETLYALSVNNKYSP